MTRAARMFALHLNAVVYFLPHKIRSDPLEDVKRHYSRWKCPSDAWRAAGNSSRCTREGIRCMKIAHGDLWRKLPAAA